MSKVQSSQQYLSELAASCEKIIDEARQIFTPLSGAQLNWKPASESWSIAQCLDHLNISNASYYTSIARFIPAADTAGTATDTPFRSSFMGGFMIRTLQPGGRLKMPTFRSIKPSESTIAHTVVDDFITSQQTLLDYLRRSNELPIGSISMTSPFSKLVHFNLGDAYGIIVVHTQRHLLQARRVMQQQEFPA